ncbi:MAG: adenosine deaminase [Thermoleophilia bacterium]
MRTFIDKMPKVELHVHLEGTLEPEHMFRLAARNGVRLRHGTVGEARAAREFSDLQSFLDEYYEGASVLRREADFYELTRAYLLRAHADGIRHAEVFFDPQTHTGRGVPFDDVVSGIHRALVDARSELDISSLLIMCLLRDRGLESAEETLDAALQHLDRIAGLGLDSAELGHPPRDFTAVFARAREAGLRIVAHAGEEGPPAYISEALDLLAAERIDHGVRCLEDDALVTRLVAERVPLTVCPVSNVRLRVFDSLEGHNLKKLLDRGLVVTVNSDDPAYFGGYLTDNFNAVQTALGLDRRDVLTLASNAVEAAFCDEQRRGLLKGELMIFAETWPEDPSGDPGGGRS